MSLGIGARYQLPRELDIDDSDAYSFVPIYGVVKYALAMEGNLEPYVIGHLGYNLFISDLENLEDLVGFSLDTEGGVYWGIGAGARLQSNLFVEAVYNTNAGGMSGGGEEADATYGKFTMTLVVSF
jgi:hypothetical protein